MTQKQLRELDDIATPDCPITICGGFAENAMGLKNRKYAETLNIEGDVYLNGELVIPEWRNTGYPAGRDVDYWTPPGSTFENDIEAKLGKIFNTIDVDNYNNRWRNIPDGSVTFWGNGTYTRKPGRWQKYIEWGDYE
jgi:hypothetical protein